MGRDVMPSLTTICPRLIVEGDSTEGAGMENITVAQPVPALRIQLCFYREAAPAFHVAEHRYDIHQWYVCLHGKLSVHLDGNEQVLGPEQSVVVRPNTARRLDVHRQSPGYLVLVFEAPGLDLTALENRLLTMPTALREDLQALIHEVRQPGEDSALLLQTLILRLLIGLKRALAGTSAVAHAHAIPALNDASQRDLVMAAEAYLLKHLDQPMQRREIAAALHLSGSHLARVFRAATGRTLVQRLTDLRLEKARQLLLESTLSVTQVASAVGIVSFSHFTRTFKRAVGVSPGSYRRTRGLKWE